MHEQLHIRCEHLTETPACREFRYILHNPADEPVWVEEFELFRAGSLEELGQLADPPLTKDAIAGRIRRLLAMADKRAADLGIPNTEASLTPDMLVP